MESLNGNYIDVFEVVVEKRDHTYSAGYFLSENKAKETAQGQKVIRRDAIKDKNDFYLIEKIFVDSSKDKEHIKKIALAKLTDEEKKALGI